MVPTIIKWLNGEEFVIAIDRSLNRDTLLRECQVRPGTYGAELAQRMLQCVFGGLVDLERDYSTYYRKEYKSLSGYLFWKHGLAKEDVKELTALLHPERLIARGNLKCGGDYCVSQWAEYSGGDKVLMRILHCSGGSDENSV